MIAQTHMQTDMDMDMGACIYMGLEPRDIGQSRSHQSIQSNSSDGPRGRVIGSDITARQVSLPQNVVRENNPFLA
jgi:hypothetical protein